jgi:dTDP-4-amino-4,6-dideoxygalactose transaminase
MHLYVIECDRRNDMLKHLKSVEIGAGLHYPLAVHQHSAYADRIRGGYDLPITEQFYKRNLSLPMFPELTEHNIEKVIIAVQNFFESL